MKKIWLIAGLLITANFASAGDGQELAKKAMPELLKEAGRRSLAALWDDVAVQLNNYLAEIEQADFSKKVPFNELTFNTGLFLVRLKIRMPSSTAEKKQAIAEDIEVFRQRMELKKDEIIAFLSSDEGRIGIIKSNRIRLGIANNLQIILNKLDELKNSL